jgi:Gpi18-like mannosyltransferase
MTANQFAWRAHTWLWTDVLAPLLITRLALLMAGWLARYFPVWPLFPQTEALARGWLFSPHRLLDMWGRWDAGWYINLAREWYVVRGDLTQVQSNLPFFPLYPFLIRLVLWLIPDRLTTPGLELAAALLVSNVMLVGGLILLHRWVAALTDDPETARRTVLYLLLFPTGFILSTAYTEATFLFGTVAAFYAAQRRAWAVAGAAAFLVGLTRPTGVAIVPALIWLYMDSVQWQFGAIRRSIGWLLAASMGALGHFVYMYWLTGDLLAPMHAQQAFFRGFAWPWTTILTPINNNPLSGPPEQAGTILFLILAVVAIFRLPSAAYGLHALAIMVPPLFTGTLTSQLRYNMMALAVLILLARWGRRADLDRLIQTVFLTLQVMFMIAWARFYWVT